MCQWIWVILKNPCKEYDFMQLGLQWILLDTTNVETIAGINSYKSS